jgi:hypothetical protein
MDWRIWGSVHQELALIFTSIFGIKVKPTLESAVLLRSPYFLRHRDRFGVEKNIKKYSKNSEKTLDFVYAIWFNAIISLGADEKTH